MLTYVYEYAITIANNKQKQIRSSEIVSVKIIIKLFIIFFMYVL